MDGKNYQEKTGENNDELKEQFFAHIRNDNGREYVQTVEEHCRKTAEYCRENLAPLELGELGYFIGLVHDMGKYSDKFQKYLRSSADGENVRRGSVNHTFAGVIYILENFNNGDIIAKITAELAAFAVGSHHGMFDSYDPDKNSGFDHRLECSRQGIEYRLAAERFHKCCAAEKQLKEYFQAAVKKLKVFEDKIFCMCQNKAFCNLEEKGDIQTSYDFMLGMLARILLSALIDADRRDTAEFMSGSSHSKFKADKALWQGQLDYLEKKLGEFKADSVINCVRKDISDEAARFAANHSGGGVYRLNVPTGAGKTLTALRYAYTAAVNEKDNVSRIFCVMPLLSVLDQNAKVIRDNSFDKDIVTEHHSNVIKENLDADELDRYELICENWNNGIIITTLVQLLNTLFSGNTSCIRRMNALAGSVIIIDEVQSVPFKMLYMFNLAVDFLAYFCGCKVVLCSATQPCFEKVGYCIAQQEDSNIIKPCSRITDTFRRTRINDMAKEYISLDGLTDLSLEIMEDSRNLLVICNTKRSALSLFKELKLRCSEDIKLYCLTAAMCMKHREDVLEEINRCLKSGEKMICVSTQLVEAGVDFSFESLIRLQAGLDNLAQSAGRCNRSFDYGHICSVYLVRADENFEKLDKLEEIKNARRAAGSLLDRFRNDSSRYDDDILSGKSVAEYYQLLFKNIIDKDYYRYQIVKPFYNNNIFDMLSSNLEWSPLDTLNRKYVLNQAFAEAGKQFTVFDDNTYDLIVPYDETAKKIIADMNSQKAGFDIGFMAKLVSMAKPYTVSVFSNVFEELTHSGMIKSYNDGHIFTLDASCYDEMTGIALQRDEIY